MISVFISFAPDDSHVAGGIASGLAEFGLFVRLSSEFVPDDWEEVLNKSDVAVVLHGGAQFSATQFSQLKLIEEHNRSQESTIRVLPILLPGGVRPSRPDMPFVLTTVPWIDAGTYNKVEDLIRRLVIELTEVHVEAPIDNNAYRPPNPYLGLAAFDEENASQFFGRQGLIESITEDVVRSATRLPSTSRFLALVGPSGIGKSSLMFAGLIPAMKSRFADERGETLRVVRMRPGNDPVEALAIAFAKTMLPLADVATIRNIMQELEDDERALHIRCRMVDPKVIVVVVVDQLEEIYTQTTDINGRTALLRNLVYAATHPDGTAHVLVTLRSDFYGNCSSDPALAFQVSSHQVLVSRMERAELREAIEMPALQNGVHFEPGLIDRLISDAGRDIGALPLLQFALLILWDHQAVGRTLTHSDYDAVGGVGGALAQRADSLFLSLDLADQQVLKRLMLRLVQPGDRTDDTRRRVPLSELNFRDVEADGIRQMIEVLSSAQSRLVVVSDELGEPTVEIVHEALLTQWPLLHEWINAEREALLFHRGLIAAANSWRHEQDNVYLLRGSTLDRAIAFADVNAGELNVEEDEFLKASLVETMSEQLSGPSADLAAKVEAMKSFGARALDAVATLAASEDPRVERRALLLKPQLSEVEIESLTDALGEVEPSEFALMLSHLLRMANRNALGSAFAEQAKAVGRPDQRVRYCLAACQASPQAADGPGGSEQLVEALVQLDPAARSTWIPHVMPVKSVLYSHLIGIMRSSSRRASGRERCGIAVDIFLALIPIPANHLADLLMLSEPGLQRIVQRVSGDLGAYGNLEEVRKELADEVSRPRDSHSGHDRVGAIAALTSLDDFQPLVDVLQSPTENPSVMYDLSRQMWERGTSFDSLLTGLQEARSPVVRACFVLALQKLPERENRQASNLVIQLFQSDPDALVHSSCGLLIETWMSRATRVGLEAELPHSPDETGERRWWVTTVTGQPLTMVHVAPRSFLMGSEPDEPGRSSEEVMHSVIIREGFYLADRVLTRGEYEPLAVARGAPPFTDGLDEWCPTSEHPMVSQTWDEAFDLCSYLSDIQGGRGRFMLPTEAEWEFACRAGTRTAYYFGDDSDHLGLYAWYMNNCPQRHAMPPRLLWPNPLGLFDMHGGVYEWCADYQGPYPIEEIADPVGPLDGPGKILRGGGYRYSAVDCRSAHRYFTQRTNRNTRIGIRLAMKTGA
jgi:formylglycine-generating enzyme required for sulfatase activity